MPQRPTEATIGDGAPRRKTLFKPGTYTITTIITISDKILHSINVFVNILSYVKIVATFVFLTKILAI